MEKNNFITSLQKYESSLIENHIESHPFLLSLDKGEVSIGTVKRLAVEYVYFYDRIFDFIAPSLSWQYEPRVGKNLSNWFVKTMANLRPEYLEGKIRELGIVGFQLKDDLSLPANKAIQNQMLLLSLNHPYSFVSCLETCFNSGWQMDQVIESLKKHQQYHVYAEIFTQISKYLNEIRACLSWLNDEVLLGRQDETFIKKHLKLLTEKFEMLYIDIYKSDYEFEMLQIPELLQTNEDELEHV